jgi:hypothetical protein
MGKPVKKILHLHDPDKQPTTAKPPHGESNEVQRGFSRTMTRSITELEGKPSHVPLAAVYWREGRMVGVFFSSIYER